ncbi:TrmH family RNA methyltransferase [Lentiprolixibacter aurantiacus]|uniref:RNA methyltransferase n=1 Tax=Lentiprolixibacter aurantiacus TaxID=2993939 RepID=A0AAE3MP46_9FLAO|nr:RNA methyltransferase [Lentiprolixibacter aurantiacus]MCX2720429.1 RNA methyltransferase [Lentiprolixibacter aurantiacus]
MRQGKHISSLQNPLVRQILQLKEKKRGRDKTGLFILEGQRELQLALRGGYEITKVFFCADIISLEELANLFPSVAADIEAIELSREVYRRVAYREKTEGMLALAKAKSHKLQDLEFHRRNPLILIAQSPEKPGNLGALLRTADAADLDAVILADPKSDLYNPNIIRSSVGCLFTVNIAVDSSDEVLQFLKEKEISLYSAALTASQLYSELDYTGPVAIAVGTEATGLTDRWISESDASVIIPMKGQIDSMNLSVSAAILIFEALRQRNFD